MELIYREDIQWHDLPKIEKPFFAQAKVSYDITSPCPRISGGFYRNPLDKIYKPYTREIDQYKLAELYKKIEDGRVLLVHFSEHDVFSPAFSWQADEAHKDKGQWVLNDSSDICRRFHLEGLLRNVRKPQAQGGNIRASSDALFPGANTADSRRAIVNSGIETVNTVTESARNRELAEYADRYPQLNSGASNPVAIDKLKYDNQPYGEFAETMVGAVAVLGTRNPSKLVKGNKGNKRAVDASGTEAYQDGLAYRKDLPKHLAGPHGFKNNGTLHGTHNQSNAINTLKEKSATYEIAPTNTPGISELKYKYFDKAKGKYVTGKKTVYDPDVYSDQKILEMSQSAGQRAFDSHMGGSSQNFYDITENGVNFRAYINIDPMTNSPYVGNVHPIK